MLLILSVFAYAASILQPEHYLPWVSWHSEVAGFAAAILYIFSSLRFVRKSGNNHIRLTTASLVLLLLLIINVLQKINGQIVFFGDFFVVAIYLLIAVLVLMVSFETSILSHQESFLHSDPLLVYCKVILVLSLLSAMLAFAQVLGVADGSYYVLQPVQLRRPGANMGQPNHLGTLLATGLISIFVLNHFEKVKKLLFFVAIFILSFGVIVTESRTALVSIIFLGIFQHWKAKFQPRSKASVLFLFYFMAMCMMYVAWPKVLIYYQSGGLFDGSVEQTANFKAGARLVVWPQLLHATLIHPWFGWGIREISRAHNTVLSDYTEGEPFSYAHSIFIDSLVGIGIPLTLLLFGLIVLGMRKIFEKKSNLRSYFIFSLLIPLITHSFFEFPFAYSYFLFPGLFLLGLLSAEMKSKVLCQVRLPIVFGIFFTVVAMATWTVIEYVQIEDDFRVTRFQAANIGDVPSDWNQSNIFVLDQLSALVQISRAAPSPGMKSEEIELLKKVAQRFPWTATQNRYALALALNGNTEEAKRQLAVMRAMHGEVTNTQLLEYWVYLSEKYPILQRCF